MISTRLGCTARVGLNVTKSPSSSAGRSLWLDVATAVPHPEGLSVEETQELIEEGLPGSQLDIDARHARDRLRAWVVGAEPSAPRVGRYIVLDKLGSGGMGTVYSAYDEELDRKIALKLLHQSSATQPEAQHRLLREAQALARLSHPNLVQVFEVGRHEGQIYLAMELVAGKTMQTWVTEDAPSLREILRAWIDVGRALQVVHAGGLVHRDVKPTNVVMGEDGRARLVDFGLAREVGHISLNSESNAAVSSPAGRSGSRLAESVTQSRAVLGTPAYLAPEQRMGEPLGPAADQYSFCVSLYEALYGCRPPGDVPVGTQVRAPEGKKVPPAVRNALSRGLAMQADARFESVGVLVDTLEKHFRPRRRARWLIGGAAVGLAATAAIGWLRPAVGAQAPLPCEATHSELDSVWDDRARAEIHDQGKTGAVTVLDAFAAEWVHVRRDVCEATRIEGVQSEAALERRMACLDRQREQMGAVVAGARRGGLDVDALTLLSAPTDCKTSSLTDVGWETPSRLREPIAAVRVSLAEARVRAMSDDIDGARDLASLALGRATRLAHEPIVAETLVVIGVIETLDHRAGPARDALEQAIDLAESHGAVPLKEEALGHLVRLAVDVESDADRALRTWERNAATLRRLGDSRTRAAGLLSRLGLVQLMHEQPRAAEVSLQGALTLYEREGARANPQRVSTLHNLANTLKIQGRSAAALQLLAEAGAVPGASGNGDTWGAMTAGESSLAQGQALLGQGRLQEAREHLGRALSQYSHAHGAFSPGVADAHAALTAVAVSEGKLEDARRHAVASDLAYRRSTGVDDPRRLSSLAALGTVAFELGDASEAIGAFEQALGLAERTSDPDAVALAMHRSNLAEALLLDGRLSRARRLTEQALSTMEAHLPSDHEDLAFPLRALGEARTRQGEAEDGIVSLRRAVLLRQASEAYPVERARTRAWLARALDEAGHGAEAHAVASTALAELSSLGDAYRADVADMRRIVETSTSHP